MKPILFIILMLLGCESTNENDISNMKNSAPKVVKKQADIRLDYGTLNKTVDLSLIFNDPDLDPLTYTFSFSDLKFFTTNQSPNQSIEFTFNEGVFADSAVAFVKATDMDGLFSCDTFQIVFNPKPNKGFFIKYTDYIDYFSIRAESYYPVEMADYSFEWQTITEEIQFDNFKAANTTFNLPNSSTDLTIELKLITTFNDTDDVKIQQLTIPRMTDVRRFGLGKNLESGKSNDQSYAWYYDQSGTGIYSSINCGPTATTMAIKWANSRFGKSPEDARNRFRSGGGWWYTTDITKYLSENNVSYSTVDLSSMLVVKSQIDKNNIVILCLDMYYIRSETGKPDWRLDKFYSTGGTGWGHFIVVKGYKFVDSELYFEVYDPYSYGRKYSDNSIKGMNRYYRSDDLDKATGLWWDYAIVVRESSNKISEGLDEKDIPVQKGQ